MRRPSSPTASTTRPRASAPACWRERETSTTPAFPGLWKLRDTRGDGRADERKLLHDGYGVHVGFLGHDLHGLKFGPDGRLYFSIGDRGFNVTTFDGKTLAVPDTGSVLRCNPDGTELEVFATGLRNPQELAFDQYGNLFTGDNNSDSGDRARWVYLVEGGDSGWRIGYQFLEAPYTRGPWNEEKLWYPSFAGQAAYIVPPIANLADGPSGLAYDPGVSLLPAAVQEPFFPGRFPRLERLERDPLVRARAPGGFVQAGRFQAVRLVGAGDRRRFRPRRCALFLRLGRRLGQAEEGADLPPARRVAARRSGRSRSEGASVAGDGATGGSMSSPGCWRTLTCGCVRRRSSSWPPAAARRGRRLRRSPASKAGTLPRIHAVWGLGQAARSARDGQSPQPVARSGAVAR